MQAKTTVYSASESAARIDSILSESDSSFEELKEIPDRSRLTFNNGFYVWVSTVFIDIRGSSKLTDTHKRPTLAKLYRAFISECVAVLNNNAKCSEVFIHGDAVWGVFDTPYKSDIDSVFETTGRLNSLVTLLNCRFKRRSISEIECGIGVSYGRALMIKAGYRGSGINDIVWMGDVVNEAAHLSGLGNATWTDQPIKLSEVFKDNLKDDYRAFTRRDSTNGCWEASVINTHMEEWIEEKCD